MFCTLTDFRERQQNCNRVGFIGKQYRSSITKGKSPGLFPAFPRRRSEVARVNLWSRNPDQKKRFLAPDFKVKHATFDPVATDIKSQARKILPRAV